MTASLALLAALLVSADDPKAEALRREVARHQGAWAVTSFVREGKASPKELVDSIVRVVEGDHVVWKRDGKSFAGTTVALDPSKDPATIDVTPDGGPSRGERVLGIYQLDGDALTICMADPGRDRPRAFEAPEGSKQTLMTFRRDRKPPRRVRETRRASPRGDGGASHPPDEGRPSFSALASINRRPLALSW
jgi:uncharacterized protein (TIGR03067 family)